MMLLDIAAKKYGVPEQILMDQGTQFTPARGEISRLIGIALSWVLSISGLLCVGLRLVARLRLSIKLTKLSLACSVSTGVLYVTNYIRPHEGINYLTPAEIYLKD